MRTIAFTSISPQCVGSQCVLAQCLHIEKVLSMVFLSLIDDRPVSLISAFLPTPAILCPPSLAAQAAWVRLLGVFFSFCHVTNFFKTLATVLLSWCHFIILTVPSGF